MNLSAGATTLPCYQAGEGLRHDLQIDQELIDCLQFVGIVARVFEIGHRQAELNAVRQIVNRGPSSRGSALSRHIEVFVCDIQQGIEPAPSGLRYIGAPALKLKDTSMFDSATQRSSFSVISATSDSSSLPTGMRRFTARRRLSSSKPSIGNINAISHPKSDRTT